jgi:putative transposase
MACASRFQKASTWRGNTRAKRRGGPCSRRGGCPHPPGGAKPRSVSKRSTCHPITYILDLRRHSIPVTFYRRNLPHLQRDAKPHFITSVTKHRLELPPWARDIVFACCRHDNGIRYCLHAAVVMPDHIHLILTPLVDKSRMLVVPLPEIMKGIKATSAHLINRQRRAHDPVLQEESFDHVLRSGEGLDAMSLYVLENPVRKGLVSHWSEYPWIFCPAYLQAEQPTR